MRIALLRFVGLLAASGLATTPLAAQRWAGLSFDLTGGVSRGNHAPNYRNRGGAALDALVALRRVRSSSPSFLVALALGVQGMTVGRQTRLELGTPPWGRIGLVGSARAALVPTIAPRTVTLGVLALGVRVH